MSRPVKRDAVKPLAGMLPAFLAALPALAGLLQELQGSCLTSHVMPSSWLWSSPSRPLRRSHSGLSPTGAEVALSHLETCHHLWGQGDGREGVAQGVHGERGMPEVKWCLGVTEHGTGLAVGNIPGSTTHRCQWNEPRGEAGRKQADGESNLF